MFAKENDTLTRLNLLEWKRTKSPLCFLTSLTLSFLGATISLGYKNEMERERGERECGYLSDGKKDLITQSATFNAGFLGKN